jgi:hypothetical protein
MGRDERSVNKGKRFLVIRTPDKKLIAVAMTAGLIGLATAPAVADVIVPPLPIGPSSQAPSSGPLPVPVPVPAVPTVPRLPAVPSLPKLPSLPQLPAPPKLPALPKLPAAALPNVLPQAPARQAAPGVGQPGGLPFGQFQDHVPAAALQRLAPPAAGRQQLGPDMPYDQTGRNTTANGVDVDVATRAYELALQKAGPHSSSGLPGLLALALAFGGGTAAVLVYRRRSSGASGASPAGA